jgi:two-component system response regulator GlrR
MRRQKILVASIEPGRHLAAALKAILVSSPVLAVEIQPESVPEGDLDFLKSRLQTIVSELSASLILLVLGSQRQSHLSELVESIKTVTTAPITVVIDADEPARLLDLLRAGAEDFVIAPLRGIDIIPRVLRLLERERRSEVLLEAIKGKIGLKQMVGESPAFRDAIRKVALVAKCNATVLISGETGTGKELCARVLHYLSPRAGKPFVPINCGAIPIDLVENELFGHKRGAFTGATGSQKGLIEEAEAGTLFLDEVDCLPTPAQVKLLRFLQEKEYRPLGSTKMRQADVRVIAATNSDVEEAVSHGKLREDLYYRLNIMPLTLPTLRERRTDIPLLARHFLDKYATEFSKELTDFSPGAMQALLGYEWPGNVRELEHVVQRASVLADHSIIQTRDIVISRSQVSAGQASMQQAKAEVVARFEKTYVQGLLLAHKGNITRAAQAAKKNRRAFWQLIRKHSIDVESFKLTT